MRSTLPLVSVVIPVYNGEEFIADAIQSVLAQTYTHFDLTIASNRSTDRTVAIAQELAARDPRVRVRDFTEFVSVVDSHNRAFTQVSDDAKYCKILGADDWLFPRCLEEMVGVAETHPTIGMVTSFVLSGAKVGWDGLPYPSTFLSGREVCRLRLLHGIKVFGGPSASLIRADILRKKRPFYNPRNYHGDNEAYLDLLQDHDFGFVHQVLSYNRKGEKSRTTAYLDRVESQPAADVDELTKFGPVYLTERERATRLREAWRAYYQLLGRSLFEFRSKEFWHYHLEHVASLGHIISYPRLALFAAFRLADVVCNPLRTVQGIVRRLAERTSRGPAASGAAVARKSIAPMKSLTS
jgi:glycosyltransferase involved in cell wall biosynthesis